MESSRYLLDEKQKWAINQALMDIQENRVYNHERAMEIIKEQASKHFQR